MLKKLPLILCLISFSSGCATILSGTEQDIKISSAQEDVNFKVEQLTVSGSKLYLEGTAPQTISLKKKLSYSYLISFSKDGLESEEYLVEYNKINPVTYINFLAIPIGLYFHMIDALNGSLIIMEPNEIHADLSQLPVENTENL